MSSSEKKLSVERVINASKFITASYAIIGILLYVGSLIFIGTHYESAWWLYILSVLLSLVISTGFYYFSMTKWRIWAYNNVVSMYELENASDTFPSSYISVTSSLALTRSDKDKLKEIERKIKVPPEFEDDPEVPDKKAVQYSKSKIYRWLVFYVSVLLVFGLTYPMGVFDNVKDAVFVGSILLAVLGFQSYRQIRRLLDTRVFVVLSNEGVEDENGLHSWKDVSNENVNYRWGGGGSDPYFELNFDYNGGTASVRVKLFNVSPLGLQHMLYVYRGRYCSRTGTKMTIKHGENMEEIESQISLGLSKKDKE